MISIELSEVGSEPMFEFREAVRKGGRKKNGREFGVKVELSVIRIKVNVNSNYRKYYQFVRCK